MNDELLREDFNKAWMHYWYHKKSLSRRLQDSMDDEQEVCALFMETLNDLGMLDKAYNKSWYCYIFC